MPSTIHLRPGSLVKLGDEIVRIERIADFDTVVVSDRHNRVQRVPIADILQKRDSPSEPSKTKMDSIRLAKIDRYATAFAGILDPSKRSTKEVKKAGEQVGISVASAYRALGRYDASGTIDELPPPTRPGGKGKSRIAPEADETIRRLLRTRHPGPFRVLRSLFVKNVKKELRDKGLSVADSTIWARLKSFDPGPPRNSRRNRSQGQPTQELLSSHYPSTRRPLETVQVDHWRADAEIVSEDRLQAIGRFTLTMGIDVHTRMIYCAHVGLHAPGSIPFGLAMINGMTRKQGLAERLSINLTLPMAGVPTRLYLDNAGEFTGNMVKGACRTFNIQLTLRPVESPEYGGHIERLLGTFATRFKSLPGATGSNIQERRVLEPMRTAAMTLEDMERHIWLLIEEYHHTPHSALGGKTPLEAYQCHFFDQQGPIRPLPKFFADDISLWIHWWPIAFRTIRRTGVRFQELDYVSDELGPLLRRKAEWSAQKMEIRIDPLSARHVYLRHPEDSNRWIKLHCKLITMPDVSHESVRDAVKQARAEKRKPVPGVILDIIKRQEKNVEDATKMTKLARRKAEKGRHVKRMKSQREIPISKMQNEFLTDRKEPTPGRGRQKVSTNIQPSSVAESLAQISEDDISGML